MFGHSQLEIYSMAASFGAVLILLLFFVLDWTIFQPRLLKRMALDIQERLKLAEDMRTLSLENAELSATNRYLARELHALRSGR